MKKRKHINYDKRKSISSGISHNMKLKSISEILDLDPTSVSREVKRNRSIVEPIKQNNSYCPKLLRWPFNKFIYNAKTAQNFADYNLKSSRRGLDITSDDFKQLDTIIKNGIDNNKSIYQIKIENKDNIDKSVTTLYRYINKGYLTTKRIDLPYAVKFKKRIHNKKYEYSENNKIDRTGHTYLDYLAFLHKNPGIYVWQLDFLGAIKTDNNNILTFILPNIQFTLLDIINKPDSSK